MHKKIPVVAGTVRAGLAGSLRVASTHHDQNYVVPREGGVGMVGALSAVSTETSFVPAYVSTVRWLRTAIMLDEA